MQSILEKLQWGRSFPNIGWGALTSVCLGIGLIMSLLFPHSTAMFLPVVSLRLVNPESELKETKYSLIGIRSS